MPEKPSKLMPALYGGIIIGAISGIPFVSLINCLCCAGVLFGGFMSVYFYKNQLTQEMPPLASNDGLALGAIAGVIGAVIANILSGILVYAIGNVTGDVMLRMMERFRDSMPAESWDQMEEGMRRGGISVMNVVISLILYPIFGLLGGLIGYSVFKPKPVKQNA